LGSDFDAGDNVPHGLHQRCRVQYLRTIPNRKKNDPQDERLLTQATQVKVLCEEAVA
jgi:hypothetical protein